MVDENTVRTALRSAESLGGLARRLAVLAEDPHPGLATWCIAFWNAEKALREALVARADVPLAPGEAPPTGEYVPPNFSAKVVLLSLMRGSLEVDTPEDMRRNLDSAAFLVIPKWPAQFTWWMKSPAEWDEWVKEQGFL